jgi:hypothetical protein
MRSFLWMEITLEPPTRCFERHFISNSWATLVKGSRARQPIKIGPTYYHCHPIKAKAILDFLYNFVPGNKYGTVEKRHRYGLQEQTQQEDTNFHMVQNSVFEKQAPVRYTQFRVHAFLHRYISCPITRHHLIKID